MAQCSAGISRLVSGHVMVLLTSLVVSSPALAQAPSTPKGLSTLNGLRVLYLYRPTDPTLEIKLRINSGAAFDLRGKEGTMALLSDMFFPDEATRDYITSEPGGSLRVTTTYDYIDVDIQAPASNFERIIDLLRAAVVSPPIPPETFATVKSAKLKSVQADKGSPAGVAEQAFNARLFGSFPYGRPVYGTETSINQIVRGDLMLARDRLLSPNNSTLVIAGNIQEDRVMRAVRQLLGGWRRTEVIPPQSFSQPVPPKPFVQIVDVAGADTAEVRVGARGISRSAADYPVARVLAEVLRQRLKSGLPGKTASLFVRSESFSLTGRITVGLQVSPADVGKTVMLIEKTMQEMGRTGPTTKELEDSVAAISSADGAGESARSTVLENMQDSVTYKVDAEKQLRSSRLVTSNQVKELAQRLFGDGSIAAVAAGPSSAINAGLSKGQIEVPEIRPRPTK
jgi:zinc protease